MKASLILPSLVLDEEILESLKKHFNSLDETTPRGDYEFIIVDNGSNFGVELMKEKADVYVFSKEKLGYAKAVNIGVEKASQDIIIVSNNDIYFCKDWLNNMLETLNKFPGIVMMDNTQVPQEGYVFNDPWMSLWAMKKEDFISLGKFDDEKLNWRFHDQELCIKVKQSKGNVVRDKRVAPEFINSLTYNKLKKDKEESEEGEIMIKRYGTTTYVDWYNKNNN